MMRKLLKQSISELIGNCKKIGLHFSGGTDSLCMLFSCLDLGVKPTLYTYYLKGNVSEDLQMARDVKSAFSVPLVEVPCPANMEYLERDVKYLLKQYDIKGSVNLQCCWGQLHLRCVVGEKLILNGSGVDGLYGVYKHMLMKGIRKDKRLFDIEREKYHNDPYADGIRYCEEMYIEYGIRVVFPYMSNAIYNYLTNLSWDEMNKPCYKYIIVKDYEEYFKQHEIYRKRGSQNLVSGIKQFHEKLLSRKINKNKRTRLLDLYRDIKCTV
jgi:asparagine synthetase B (glutamine-hydrolysing)